MFYHLKLFIIVIRINILRKHAEIESCLSVLVIIRWSISS